MKPIHGILYLILQVSLNLQSIFAQSERTIDSTLLNWKSYFENLYGLDYNLINGRRYVNLYSTADGHPFLGENSFYRGNIIINNKSYKDVEIKYDICNQEILLQYKYFSGNTDIIILVEKFIDGFEMDGRLFRKYNFPETGPRFYQVVSQGNFFCLYYWKKEFNKGLSAHSFFAYSPEKHLSYLVIDNKIYHFKGRKSFLKLFPQKYNNDIKLFLRSNKLWIRNASDTQIRQLMDFCNELISQK
jgi:hypothetical protein